MTARGDETLRPPVPTELDDLSIRWSGRVRLAVIVVGAVLSWGALITVAMEVMALGAR